MDVYLLIVIAAGLSLTMAAAWIIQRATGQSGWIDTIWSFGVGIGGIAAALLADGPIGRRLTILALVLVWALRLGGHIGARTRGGGEDPRYAKLAEQWGNRAALRLLLFLQVQAAAAFILVFAIYLAAINGDAFPGLVDVIATTVAIVALVGETMSDAQLARFRKTPQAKTDICELGLWRYSRHPNYFFEWLFWCAFALFALDTRIWSWLALLAPLLMYWLLVHVSGIPPLEDHMLASRGEKFRALQKRVNAFFPGPRKSAAPHTGDT